MGFYQFKKEDAFEFARFLNIKTQTRGDELVFKVCPFCRATSKGNREKFAINLNTGAFNCLRASCGAHGSFYTLAKEYGFSLGADVDAYEGRGKQYRTFSFKHIESKDAAVAYCKSRGISEETCKKYELTVQRDKPNILVFPFRDMNGIVCFVKYRKTDFDKEKDTNKEWCEKDGKPILFGINHCDMAHDTLVLTEGQLDSLSLDTAGIDNAVSVPTGARGATWIPHCWDFVRKFKTLIVFGDCEKGQITLVDMVATRFPGVNVKVVREEDYGGCKDANEILQTYGKDALIKAVENAEPIPIAQLVDYTEIEQVRILDMPFMSTHITELDSVLTRGLYYGQVILLTGQRGDGKSTFMQQIVCTAIDSEVKTFLYSGELPNYVVRNFTDTMLSGMHENELRPETVNALNNTYRGRLYLYDFNVIKDDEHTDLLKIIEQSITQYGCRLICIDNLMTVVEGVSSDALYQEQKHFVGQLTKIAKLYNVIVILVAHPRKRVGGDVKASFTNDDVSGSSDITNKVDVVMSYQRCRSKDYDESMRELWITKNRLTGELAVGDNAIKLKYEKRTRRITGEDQTFGWHCQWEKALTEKPIDLDFRDIQYNQSEFPF